MIIQKAYIVIWETDFHVLEQKFKILEISY